MSSATWDALGYLRHHHRVGRYGTGAIGDVYPPEEVPTGFLGYMRVPQKLEEVVFK